jgi:Tfp pilus assembly protein PilF
LEIDAKYPKAHFLLACAYETFKSFEEAKKHYGHAIEFHPEFAFAHFRLGVRLFEEGFGKRGRRTP